MAHVLDPLDTARAAASRQTWREAYDAYSVLDAVDLTGSDLESYAEAAWWAGRLEKAIALRERAYGRFTADQDELSAARIALTLAWDYEGRGEFAVAGGWLANADRRLSGLPVSAEHGRLALTRAITALFAEGDLEKTMSHLDEAFELASEIGDRDVQMLALSLKGRVLIKRGDIDDGLGLLDEAAASAMSGHLRAHSAGLVYCMTISACQDVGDYRRAAEWTEVANRWCDRLDVSGFPGACRIHRAEILRLRGDWPAAEAQAVAACEELREFERNITAGGYYEIGEIRRQRGDFPGAEEAYRIAHELGRDPEPGRSLLLLAEGKVDAALAGVKHALGTLEDPLSRLRGLPAQVEIALAAHDLKTARSAADELESIVDSYKIGGRRAPAFDATVHLARGKIKLAEKDWEGAAESLRRARDIWQGLGAPYEIAQARLHLGIAYRRHGEEHGGTRELEAALTTFDRLGAGLDAGRVKELLGRVEARRTFLFTDIVDSTKLLDTFGPDKWKRVLARHDELLREEIAEAGGEIVKRTGDGFFASFENPKAALQAAVSIQRSLAAEIYAPDVRIGAHSGGAFHTGTDTADYGGEGVHVAARIGAVAGKGEILASTETVERAGGTFRVSGPRTVELKGLPEPVELVAVDWR